MTSEHEVELLFARHGREQDLHAEIDKIRDKSLLDEQLTKLQLSASTKTKGTGWPLKLNKPPPFPVREKIELGLYKNFAKSDDNPGIFSLGKRSTTENSGPPGP